MWVYGVYPETQNASPKQLGVHICRVQARTERMSEPAILRHEAIADFGTAFFGLQAGTDMRTKSIICSQHAPRHLEAALGLGALCGQVPRSSSRGR